MWSSSRCFCLILPFSICSVTIPTKEIAPGIRMPVVSIGTGGLEAKNASTIVASWLELGGRSIDTAWIYKNQQVLKDEFKKLSVDRDSVFITTKVPGCLSTKVYVEENLKQLGTDYIDLLLIHFPKPSSSCAQAWRILEDYHKNGTIKAIGVSNFEKEDLQKILAAASVKPHINQIQLNILEPNAETVAFSVNNNITVEAYSPLGRSGHSGDIPHNPAVVAVAAAHNVSTYQVALKWILQHGHVLTFQSSSLKHQASDADLFSFNISDEEMATLDKQALTDVSLSTLVV